MDDLDIIRLAVIDNIARGRIPRTGTAVKGKFRGWVADVPKASS
jgi:hypothetical protein